jgi:hypothetical protein
VIEKPLPLPEPTNGVGGLIAREESATYGGAKPPKDLGALIRLDARSRDHYRVKNGMSSDHVVSDVEATRNEKETPRSGLMRRGASGKTPLQHSHY